MTTSKRPKLGAVLRGNEPQAIIDPVTKPAEIPLPPAPVPTDSENAKMVQLNVAVPEGLRRKVRIKALETGVDVSVVVRQLLQQWLDE